MESQFFGSSWANYDQAKPGTSRLVPPAERIPSLRRDYQAMRDMYLSEPLSFDDILAILTDLERVINRDRLIPRGRARRSEAYTGRAGSQDAVPSVRAFARPPVARRGNNVT